MLIIKVYIDIQETTLMLEQKGIFSLPFLVGTTIYIHSLYIWE